MPTSSTVRVELAERGYEIRVAATDREAWSAPLAKHVGQRRVAVITDERVAGFHRTALSSALETAGAKAITWHLIPPGEGSKSSAVLARLYTELLEARFGRDGVVCAFGGGVVGDLAGFAAATVHRGVDLVQLPTTLMAMVDSAIGGKTGINHPLGKNLIGAFHQPLAVLSNLRVLATLDARELACGFAEVIKYGVIRDAALFERLESSGPQLRAGKGRQLLDIVTASARIKADVVSADEKEAGLRMILNFGHTLGHAIENVTGYGTFTHGEAISAGMVLAARFGVESNVTDAALVPRLERLCRDFGLPVTIEPAIVGQLAQSVARDKKVRGEVVNFVFARRLGEVVTKQVRLDRLSEWLERQEPMEQTT